MLRLLQFKPVLRWNYQYGIWDQMHYSKYVGLRP